MVLLQVIDRKWREHLYEMDYLQEGISLRAYAQRDPVVEYQREGFDMFATMMDGIKEETVGFLYNLEVQVEEPEPEEAADEVTLLDKPVEIRAKGLGRAPQQQGLQYSAPTIDGEAGAGRGRRGAAEQQAPALGVRRPAPGAPARPAAQRAVRAAAAGLRAGGPGRSVGRRPSAGSRARPRRATARPATRRARAAPAASTSAATARPTAATDPTSRRAPTGVWRPTGPWPTRPDGPSRCPGWASPGRPGAGAGQSRRVGLDAEPAAPAMFQAQRHRPAAAARAGEDGGRLHCAASRGSQTRSRSSRTVGRAARRRAGPARPDARASSVNRSRRSGRVEQRADLGRASGSR